MNNIWTEAERDFVRQHAGKLTDKVIAAKLSLMCNRQVTTQSVRKQRQKMGLKKQQGRGVCKLVEQEKESQSSQVARAVPVAEAEADFNSMDLVQSMMNQHIGS